MANQGANATHESKRPYDIFLSYALEDTQYTFTGYLYNALRQKRFKTFLNVEGSEGEAQAPVYLEAIEESRISIIVLSENYASSLWYLDELVKALECKRKANKLVCPIFYRVDPSDVRLQRNSYGKAMAALEAKFGKNSYKVERSRSALSEVGNLIGWHVGTGYEYEYIQKIVEWVIRSLPRIDVFLSFRGQDTRYSFTGFLYNALRREGFKTFMDDEILQSGNQISRSLVDAIQNSRLSIIVFSENFAYSSWCLDELVEILKCMKNKNQLVWPIFYNVDPSDVRYQKNSYGKAMTAHENRFGIDSEKVQKWRSALFEVANLKGWHFEKGYEYEFIEKIVERAIDT